VAGRNFISATGCGLVKKGEDARLYAAVRSCSNFAIRWDQYSNRKRLPFDETEIEMIAPGTVIISAGGNCTDIKESGRTCPSKDGGSIYYINLSQDEYKLGGSSFAQTLKHDQQLKMPPSLKFNTIQD
jgi:phosphoribosylformylglycinamidine synthase